MRTSEIIVLGYLVYVAAVAIARPLPRASRVRLLAWGLGLLGLVVGLVTAPAWPLLWLVRDAAPVVYIFICYHLSGPLFTTPQPGVEAQFAAFDARVQRLFGMPASIARAPRGVPEFLEGAYFGCYVGLPAGYLALALAGHWAWTDRYWSLVLVAELACYAMLPWIRTRAPWSLELPGPIDRREVTLRWVNRFVIRHVSIQVNTFPSAHTAGVLAAALGVAPVMPLTGVLLLLLAASIAAATIVGRYHYAGDAVAAVASTLAVWAGFSIAGW
ncbi:MAG: phosphatase PAP2 family protein [Planctomycetes bacterium]|nr:phosphatase PAP2 family protein [Planctomycetota bacterium]